MPVFRHVHVHPSTGFFEQAWIPEDRDDDAFAKVARGVCDLYSEGLGLSNLHHKVTTLQILLAPNQIAKQLPVTEEAAGWKASLDSNPVGRETGWAHAPRGFASWAEEKQRQAVLRAVHALCVELAECRGLDLAAFAQARSHCEAAHLTFRWSSAWKSSPDRRWKARCAFRSTNDGFGRLRVEVADRDGPLAAQSPEQVAFTTQEGFRRAAKTLRWLSPSEISVVPCVGIFGMDTGPYVVQIIGAEDGVSLSERVLPRPLGREHAEAAFNAAQVSLTDHCRPWSP